MTTKIVDFSTNKLYKSTSNWSQQQQPTLSSERLNEWIKEKVFLLHVVCLLCAEIRRRRKFVLVADEWGKRSWNIGSIFHDTHKAKRIVYLKLVSNKDFIFISPSSSSTTRSFPLLHTFTYIYRCVETLFAYVATSANGILLTLSLSVGI